MDKNEQIISQFSREAEKYTTSAIHSNKIDLEYVIEFINPQKSWNVLDVATGTGHLALKLATKVDHVIASDLTEMMLNKTAEEINKRNLQNVKIKLNDVHELGFADNTFDLTCSRIALHHFQDVNRAISEMIRVTKKGGLIFIQDTISPENNDASDYLNLIEALRDPSHVRDISPSQLISKFIRFDCELLKFTKKEKTWNLKWWMDRMSTSDVNKEKIMILLEMYEDYKDHLKFEIIDENWILHPNNGYFLFRKIK